MTTALGVVLLAVALALGASTSPAGAAGPVAEDDAITVPANSSARIVWVQGNDTDPDRDTLSLTDVSDPANGTTGFGANETIFYTPEDGFTGTDTFTYTITDGGGTDTATVTVTVVEDPPSAGNDAITVPANSPARIVWVLANDTDPDRDSLSILSVSDPPNGTTSFGPNDTITYAPQSGFTGVDTFTYTITDGAATDTATVTVTVNENTPTAVDDAATVPANSPARIVWVLANDTDPDRDTLNVTDVSDPPNGTTSFGANETILYTPENGFTGVDSFTYTITDGAATDTATVTVTVNENTPTAVDDAATVPANSPARVVWVLANDSDPDRDALSVTDVSDPPNGTTGFGPNDTITYAPQSGFTGVDSFTYTITDGAASDTATVTVSVTEDPPNAVNDPVTVPANSPARIVWVLANDTDPDRDTLNVTDVSDPPNGTTSFGANETILYTPQNGFTGVDSFTYTITDGAASDTATVTVTVQPEPGTDLAPSAVDDSAATRVGKGLFIHVPANDTDPDLDPLSILSVSDPPNGTASEQSGNVIFYNPAPGFSGTDTFTYTITDGALTDTATVTVQVNATAPSAVDDSAATRVGKGLFIHVPANDTDPDLDPLSILSVSDPPNGTASEQSGNVIFYTPDFQFSGTDTFTYTITDGALTDTATVTVTVGDPPPTMSTTSSTTSSSSTSSTSSSSTTSTSVPPSSSTSTSTPPTTTPPASSTTTTLPGTSTTSSSTTLPPSTSTTTASSTTTTTAPGATSTTEAPTAPTSTSVTPASTTTSTTVAESTSSTTSPASTSTSTTVAAATSSTAAAAGARSGGASAGAVPFAAPTGDRVAPGAPIEVTEDGFAAGSTGTVTLTRAGGEGAATPIAVREFTADQLGRVALELATSGTLTPGTYHVTLVGVGPDGAERRVVIPVVVGGVAGAGDSLARTGSDVGYWRFGAFVTSAGIALLLWSRAVALTAPMRPPRRPASRSGPRRWPTRPRGG